MVLLRQQAGARRPPRLAGRAAARSPAAFDAAETVIQVHDLVRKFGAFTAVDRISFAVHRGEIFGLLGPNGAGKTTTFRMLCGLLSATAGTLRVAGFDLRRARAAARQHIGYVAQKFSLYGQLSVAENLDFFASAYGLHGSRKRDRIAWALAQFELKPLMHLASGQLPGGYKQRLAMAAALLHAPEILFLDEPTSGADPMARREFWQRHHPACATRGHRGRHHPFHGRGRILRPYRDSRCRPYAGARNAGQRSQSGNVAGRPQGDHGGRVHRHRREGSRAAGRRVGRPRRWSMTSPPNPRSSPLSTRRSAKLRRVAALVRKETYQLFRDPSSIAIGVVMPVLLILLFGYALSLDVTNVPVAVVLEDPSPAANELAAGFALSPYFETRLLTSMPRAQQFLLQQKVDGIVRIRPDFARQLSMGDAQVQVLVYGTDANRARIIEGYAQGALAQWSARRAAEGYAAAAGGSAVMQSRLWFNEDDDSHYFLVPGLIVLIMTLIGAFLTALVMAREWERGTLEALFVTPVRAGEIVLAKMIPYFALGMIGLALCILAAKFLFHVPFRGSVLILTGASMLYLLVALAIGLLISSIAKSQFVASMATLIITFLPALFLSGFLFDLRSMPAAIRILSYALPARYYVGLLQTLFLAGDIWGVVLPDAGALAGMAFALLVLTRALAKKRLA